MNTCIRICAALSLALAAGHASAIPVLKQVTPTFFQSGQGVLSAGVVVEASTDLPILDIAGGFTITCSTSTLVHDVERRQTYSSVFGPDEALRIPDVVPSTYAIQGWSSIPAGTCGGECMMHYSGSATDSTTLSVRVGNTGVGANFTLVPQGTGSMGNSLLINVCRSGRPQCCTPRCSIQ